MTWPRSRLHWTALTFGPPGLAVCIALSYFFTGEGRDAVLWLFWAGTGWAMGNATLSSYRAGYWRGRVEEASEDQQEHMVKLVSGWQPSPWDDGRW